MATPVRNIAPFINDIFYVTSEWWTIRDGKLHRGLDIATSGSINKATSSCRKWDKKVYC